MTSPIGSPRPSNPQTIYMGGIQQSYDHREPFESHFGDEINQTITLRTASASSDYHVSPITHDIQSGHHVSEMPRDIPSNSFNPDAQDGGSTLARNDLNYIVSARDDASERPMVSEDDTEPEDNTHEKLPRPSWWWWEIAAAGLSIISLSLLITLLLKVDGLALQSWTLPIQPNSLIAVLTTIGKSAIMVACTACLSQLKWRHFLSESRQLNELQIIDDASRGPWGSFMLLLDALQFRPRGLLSTAVAFVILAALGFETSAQQILEFPTRTRVLTNATAELGVANFYNPKSWRDQTSCM